MHVLHRQTCKQNTKPHTIVKFLTKLRKLQMPTRVVPFIMRQRLLRMPITPETSCLRGQSHNNSSNNANIFSLITQVGGLYYLQDSWWQELTFVMSRHLSGVKRLIVEFFFFLWKSTYIQESQTLGSSLSSATVWFWVISKPQCFHRGCCGHDAEHYE